MNTDSRIRLSVLGISYSQIQSGAYALILAQVDGPYRIPVVIGAAEAQSIALRLESIVPPRPMTHDLFVSFAHAFGVKLKEVFIYKFEDGIFSSELTFTDELLKTINSSSIVFTSMCSADRTSSTVITWLSPGSRSKKLSEKITSASFKCSAVRIIVVGKIPHLILVFSYIRVFHLSIAKQIGVNRSRHLSFLPGVFPLAVHLPCSI